MAGQRRHLVLGSVLGSTHQAGEAFVPVLIGLVVEHAVVRPDLGALLGWLGVLAVAYVLLSGGFQLGARASERAVEQAAHSVRMELVRRILTPSAGGGTGAGADAAAGRPAGALVSVATEDARRVGTVAMALTMGVSATVGLLAGAAFLLRASLPLGLLVLLGIPVLMTLGQLLARPLERRSATEQEHAAHASGVAADLVAGVRVLKGLRAEHSAVERYRQTSGHSLAAGLRASRAQALQSGMMLALTGSFIALVALVGGRLVLNGSINLGELVAALGLALFLPGPLSALAWAGAESARGRASARRVAEVLGGGEAAAAAAAAATDAPSASPPLPHPAPNNARGELRLRGLGRDGLRELDLTVRPGELLGVVVTDPSDAATLLRCLTGRHQPATGTLELDGIEFGLLDSAELRSRLLVAEHDAQLFDGTLLENVTAAGSADPAPAMAAAGADEVAAALPGGSGAQVGERGSFLSGGQRQRVALARALAADREVLVLHDPTTAVDAATESRIAAGLRELRTERTTVLVTSSPTLLAATDRAVLIDGGRLVADAHHHELVLDNQVYRTAVLT
jgi:putative ABC transport system ATP-binding protein